MKVRIYKSPDGVGKVVNKTAQWMAQMGGVQAAQAAINPPMQQEIDPNTESQIVQLIVPMINEEPSDILNDLVSNKGIPVEIAQPVLLKVLAYKKQKEEADAAAMKENSEETQDVATNEKIVQDESQNELLVQEMMMQPNNMQDQYSEEDQFFTDNIMAYGGVKKNSYVKNVMKLLKKQQGDEVQGANIANDTDTGARQERLSDFITTLQSSANNALMKQDAENMYEQEFKRGGTTRQQRQINRGLNQIMQNMPVGFYNARMPMMPPMMGVQNMMSVLPATGSIPGGIKTANIEVKRTGFFGKPKEYSLSLTYNEPINPELYKQIIEQEEYNKKSETEEDIKEYAQKRVNTSTKENEAVTKEEPRKGDVSNSRYVTSSTQTPVVTKPKTKVVNNTIVTDDEVVETPATTGSFWDRFSTPEAQAAYQEGINKYKEQQAKIDALDPVTRWFYQNMESTDMPKKEEDLKSYKYASQFTDPGALYYDPNKKGVAYGRKGDQWFYTENGQDYKPVTDTKRLSYLNKSAKGANLFTLPSKPGYYYRQRGDGSFERFQGDPNSHSESKKSSGIISPSDPNYGYLNKAKKYTVTYIPSKQVGGFVDPSRPDLNRFIYGGNEPMSFADEVPMTNTTDPYFREGGLTKYQTAGQTRGDWEKSQGIKSEPTPRNGSTLYYYDATWDGTKWVEPSGSTNTGTYNNNTTNTFGTNEMPAWFKEWASQNMLSQGYNSQLPYNNPYIGNYNMFNPYMMQGYGQPQIYPPLFGGRGFRPPGRFIDYAGSWIQQQGMPMIAGTNTPFTGSLMGAMPTKIDVAKTSMLTGLPKKWSAEFYVPGATIGSSIKDYKAPQRFIQDAEGNITDLNPENIQSIQRKNLPGAFGPRNDGFMQNMWKNRAQRKGYDVDWSTDGMMSPNQQSSLLPAPQFTDEELGNNQLVDVQPEIFAPSYSDKELGLDQIVDVQPESFNMKDLQSMGYNITPEDFYNERLADENQAARQAFDIEQMNRAGRTMPSTSINVEDQNITPQTPAPVNTVPVNNTPVIPTTGVTADSVYTGATESSDEYCFPGGACYSMPIQLRADQRLFQELPKVLLRQDLRANKNWITDNNQLDVSKLTREDILEALMAEKGSPNAPVKDIEQYPNLNNFIDKWLEYQKGNQAAYGDYGVRQLSDEYFRPNTILTPPNERYSDWLNVMGAPGNDPNDIWENQGVLGRIPGATGYYEYGGYLPKAQFGDFNVSGCPPGYIKGADGVCREMFTNKPYFSKPEATMPSAESFMENPFDLDEDYTNPITGESPGITMGNNGEYINEGILTESDRQAGQNVKMNFKSKNMFNIDPLVGLNQGNKFINWGTNLMNAFNDRDIRNKFYTDLPSNIQPLSTSLNRGKDRINIGDSFPDQTGFKSKKGGAHKKGNVTYMSAKQVQELMKKGYKIEFIQ